MGKPQVSNARVSGWASRQADQWLRVDAIGSSLTPFQFTHDRLAAGLTPHTPGFVIPPGHGVSEKGTVIDRQEQQQRRKRNQSDGYTHCGSPIHHY